jgi:hypothetical protein
VPVLRYDCHSSRVTPGTDQTAVSARCAGTIERMKIVLTQLENAGGEAKLTDMFERSEPKLHLSESADRANQINVDFVKSFWTS